MGASDAVRRPYAAAHLERTVAGRMPVAGGQDREVPVAKRRDVPIQHRDRFIAALDGETAAGNKVVLDVDDEEGIAGTRVAGTHNMII